MTTFREFCPSHRGSIRVRYPPNAYETTGTAGQADPKQHLQKLECWQRWMDSSGPDLKGITTFDISKEKTTFASPQTYSNRNIFSPPKLQLKVPKAPQHYSPISSNSLSNSTCDFLAPPQLTPTAITATTTSSAVPAAADDNHDDKLIISSIFNIFNIFNKETTTFCVRFPNDPSIDT
ncbi:hypothetical protein BDZ45DRAFT_735516 [Acephala macrosclerotiorum]|nr:hypothetical protein BDZ45DRAFT_735516 [Acephala macrosclerotiorum]